MPQEEIRTARFDHVSDQGDLVFKCERGLFAVTVDNALDRAILEAKQVLEEEHGTPVPQASAALPISAIQTAIRAGTSTERVAQEFAVNEALVRRFASPIEVEKKYAIEQFLSMSSPKRGAGYSNEEAISRALDAANVPLGAVSWTATRRSQGPWKIRASFQAGGQAIQADWTWNMKENTITCLNTPARQLLEGSDAFMPAPAPTPEDVAAQDGYAPLPPVQAPRGQDPTDDGPLAQRTDHAQTQTVEMNIVPAPEDQAEPEPATEPKPASETEPAPETEPVTVAQSEPAAGRQEQALPLQPAAQAPASPRAQVQTGQGVQKDDEAAAAPEDQRYPAPPPAETSTEDREEESAGSSASEPSALTAWMYGGSKRVKAKKKPKVSSRNNPKGEAQAPEPAVSSSAALPSQATSANSSQPDAAPQSPGATSPQGTEQAVQEPGHAQSRRVREEPETRSPHKKSGRSAVPSWDEILFGD
ncbi:septation protein SepH [Bifidobacterium actinocoloniiforme]|nr:septation protein SepH [Bifidobacterium actinocoloniiforme]